MKSGNTFMADHQIKNIKIKHKAALIKTKLKFVYITIGKRVTKWDD